MTSKLNATATGAGSLIVAAIFAAGLLGASSLPALASAPDAGVLDQATADGTDNVCHGSAPFRAQTFTAGVSGLLDAVDVYVVHFSAGTFQIKAVDVAGLPAGAPLASGSVGTNYPPAWFRVTLDSPVPVVAGTKYAIVADNCQFIRYWYTAVSYSGGEAYASADGSTWTLGILYGADFAFRTYVEPTTTTMFTSDNPDPSVVGQPITVSASVEPASAGVNGEPPIGDILVTRGSDTCHITAPSGSCTITPSSAGTQSISAAYTSQANANGTGLFQNSTTSPAEAHTVNRATTTTVITTDDPDPSYTGQTVTVGYSVTVNSPGSGTPTGQVTVSDGTTSCSASVAAGSCSLALSGVGSHSLAASYAGDSDFSPSGSTAANHQVIAVPPLTPYQKKQSASASLSSLVPTGSATADTLLHRATTQITKSLASWRWIGQDALTPLHGWAVFNYERKTVHFLVDPLFSGNSTVSHAISDLLAADREIAVKAIAADSDANEQAIANTSLAKADGYVSAGRYAKAIHALRQAWLAVV